MDFGAWWQTLSTLNQAFYLAAMFLSVIFIWQLIAAIIGLGGADMDIESHVDSTAVHDSPHDAQDTIAAFKLMSVRSILAFFTLFSWAGALYMGSGVRVSLSLVYAALWGFAAMLIVSVLIHMMVRLTHSGNMKIGSCIGTTGSIHIDVPVSGSGEIRIMCNGVMSHFRAKAAGDKVIKSGTSVKVTRVVDANTLEVEPVDSIK